MIAIQIQQIHHAYVTFKKQMNIQIMDDFIKDVHIKMCNFQVKRKQLYDQQIQILNKETFYNNFKNYELGQLTSAPGRIVLNPFTIILTFKPIK